MSSQKSTQTETTSHPKIKKKKLESRCLSPVETLEKLVFSPLFLYLTPPFPFLHNHLHTCQPIATRGFAGGDLCCLGVNRLPLVVLAHLKFSDLFLLHHPQEFGCQ